MPALLSPAFVRLCASMFFGALAGNLLLVAPRWLRLHGLDEPHIGVVMGSYAAASLVMMPLVSGLVARFGRRRPLVAAMLAQAVGCVGFELAGGFAGWTAARALMGGSWAAIMVGSAVYTTELAPEGRLGQALGVSGILILAAMAVGPTLGELIARTGSWEWVWRTGVIVGAVGAALAATLPDLEPSTLDPRPSTPFLLWLPPIRATLVATLLVATGFGAIVSFLSDYAALRGLGGVALFFDAHVLAAVTARVALGHLSDRLGRHPVILPALASQSVSMLGLAFLGDTWQLAPLGAVFGFSHGMYYPSMQALIVERTPPSLRAPAVASSNFAFSSGVAGAAFAGGPVAHAFGYPTLFVACAALAWIGIALVAMDRERATV